MADSPSVLCYINHVEVGDNMEWDMSTEQTLGGVGSATITIQDRTLTYEPQAHWDVKVVLASGPKTGHVVFRGEIIREPLELQTGVNTMRKWKLTCAAYSYEFDWRLIGALDGKTWLDTSGLGIFVNIDPNASSLRTDRLTVQNWFDKYIRVDGQAFGTDTFVGEYLSDFITITPMYDRLNGGLQKLAAYVAGNLQYWTDPDLEFHWVLIPNWQDLIGLSLDAGDDPTGDTMALMAPSTPSSLAGDLEPAPYGVSDELAVDPDDPDKVGFHSLKIEFDGSNMPEQVYVRGSTGYVYNAPPIDPIDETKTVVKVPVPGADGTYQLTITTTTKLWHVDGTGFVSTSYDSVGAGGPWPVKFVEVKWSPSRNKGGFYWKFLSGPHAGKLADDHTNTLNGYGHIRVELVATGGGATPTPSIGRGGSGFVGEVTQDINKRQAYLEAPISSTASLRDSLGGQALYRGAFPTLRGSVQVTGYDGWRVGQLLPVTDARLPVSLNGKSFVIQRVQCELHLETLLRKYNIDFGDGPQSRYTYQPSRFSDISWPHPANAIFIDAHDLTPGPNETQIITGQLVNAAGEPWNIKGKVMEWTFECYNESGVLQTGQGSIDPEVSVTDQHGKARTRLTSGPGTNLVYFVFARVRAV